MVHYYAIAECGKDGGWFLTFPGGEGYSFADSAEQIVSQAQDWLATLLMAPPGELPLSVEDGAKPPDDLSGYDAPMVVVIPFVAPVLQEAALMPTLTTRGLKCTVLLDPAEVESLALVEGLPRVQLNIRTADGRTVIADIAAKSVRKVQATIAEHGTDGVAALLQGKLGKGDVLLEAGLVAQVKAPKPAADA